MKDSEGEKTDKESTRPAHQTTSLKHLAEHLGLNPATVSVVLNDVPGRSIPQTTRDRIKAAAKALNYQPNLLARSLRSRRTLTIGILVPELGDGYHTQVMSGIGDQLIKAGYFYFTAHHRHKRNLVEEYTRMLIGRGAQGIIAIDTLLEHPIGIPVVAVAGHRHIEGVTNVLLDHARAAELALTHLHGLGHRNIAFMRGQPFSSDSDERWKSLVKAAEQLGLTIKPELVVSLEKDLTSPELGYPVVQQLLAAKLPFTAIVAFNDISAIGAIRALQDVNLRVPDDVSVIGFDDIKAAAFTLPRLTTINQPLEEIGRIATQSLLNRIHNTVSPGDEITVEPELIVRESTGPVKT
ncbi:MAG TPA: LacI family DNA-binding transcriptional regulator [Terracidiphilus sp.]|jgi:LacI family transcriptional regulator|nr:LacI family DNA-binding transcriptional regulator [Terracidiphilus sp.]